jgi:hypothetical protein
MNINELFKEVQYKIGTKAQTAPKGGSLKRSLGMAYPDK